MELESHPDLEERSQRLFLGQREAFAVGIRQASLDEL